MLKKESLRPGCAPIQSVTASGCNGWLVEYLAEKLAKTVLISLKAARISANVLKAAPTLPVVRSSFLPTVPVVAALCLLFSAGVDNQAVAQNNGFGSLAPDLTGEVGVESESSVFKTYKTTPIDQQKIRAKSFWEPAGTFRSNRVKPTEPTGNGFQLTKSSKPEIYTLPKSNSSNGEIIVPRVEAEFSPPNSYTQSVLEKGGLLEAELRWNEALAVYQEALKKKPNDRRILSQRQLARIHVDLKTRLSDKTYVKVVKQDSPEYAMAAFNEVLSKIHAFYYTEPNWNQMVQHGIRNLAEAMKDEKFQKCFAPDGYERRYHGVVKQLMDHKNDIFVKNRAEFIRLVDTVAKLAESKCGLRQSVTINEFTSAAISSLDTYSGYLSPESFSDFTSRLQGQFVGIGVEIHITDRHLQVVKVFPGGPADDARIRAEDKILAVNGHSVQNLGGNQVADLLKGTEGSQLTVLVETPEKKEYLLRMKRRHIEVSSISKAEIVNRAKGVGYIQLNSFQKNTVNEFDTAMLKLHRQGMKSLVLDLRDNPGGVLEVCITLANRFLPSGKIVTTRGRNRLDNMERHADTFQTWNIPLVVLIDENSASASEILAAAIADNRRGHVIGTRSYGKGSVQGIFPLASGRGGLRLTTAKFFSPTGRAISLQGVSPTKTLEVTAKVPAGKETAKKKVVFGSKEDKLLAASIRLVENAQPKNQINQLTSRN